MAVAKKRRKKDVTTGSDSKRGRQDQRNQEEKRDGLNADELHARSDLQGIYDEPLLSAAVDRAQSEESRERVLDELEQRFGWLEAARRLVSSGPRGISVALRRWGEWLVPGEFPPGLTPAMAGGNLSTPFRFSPASPPSGPEMDSPRPQDSTPSDQIYSPTAQGATSSSRPGHDQEPMAFRSERELRGAERRLDKDELPGSESDTPSRGTPVQLKGRPGRKARGPSTGDVVSRLAGGEPIEEATRKHLEQLLGVDLSEVRIHTDSQAETLADEMDARAFTVGRDVAFARGEYRPESLEGRRLLAHELAHVFQQSEGRVPTTEGEGGPQQSEGPVHTTERKGEAARDMDPLAKETSDNGSEIARDRGFNAPPSVELSALELEADIFAEHAENSFNNSRLHLLDKDRPGSAVSPDPIGRAAPAFPSEAIQLKPRVHHHRSMPGRGSLDDGDEITGPPVKVKKRKGGPPIAEEKDDQEDRHQPGPDKKSGPTKPPHKKGDKDHKGEKGEKGDKDHKGEKGERGEKDHKGEKGEKGHKGAKAKPKHSARPPGTKPGPKGKGKEKPVTPAPRTPVPKPEPPARSSGGVFELLGQLFKPKPGLPAPQMEAPYSAFKMQTDNLRDALKERSGQVKEAIVQAADKAIEATKAAGEQLEQNLEVALKAARATVEEDAKQARKALAGVLQKRQEELRARNQAQLDRVLEASTEQQAGLKTRIEQLAGDARQHGATKADEILAHAKIQAEMALAAGAAVTRQYKDHDRANDIRITATKMAKNAAQEILTQAQNTAPALKEDAEALAQKIEKDGRKYLEKMEDNEEDALDLFSDLLEEGLEALEDSADDSEKSIDKAEKDALRSIDNFEDDFKDGIRGEVKAKVAGIESARDDSIEVFARSINRTLEELDNKAKEVDEWVHEAHPSQWPAVSKELKRLAGELRASGQKALEDVLNMKGRFEGVFLDLGDRMAKDILSSEKTFVGKLDEVVRGTKKGLDDIPAQADKGLGGQIDTLEGKWRSAADGKIEKFGEIRKEADEKLEKTFNDGAKEITEKFNKAVQGIDKILAQVRTDVQAKAQELAKQSAFDRFLSGLKNFALGLLDSVVGFLKALLIVALIILAVVIIVAIIILIIGGAAALGAAVAAVGAFLAAAAQVLAVIGIILTVIGIAFAVVSLIRALMDPNMSTDEKCRAAGKAVGDIAMEFIPDFGISLLTKADDVSDVAKMVDNISDAMKAGDNLEDVASLTRQLQNVAGKTDELGDMANRAQDLQNLVDGASDVAKQGDNLIKSADDIGDITRAADKTGDVVKAGDSAGDVVKAGDHAGDVVKAGDNAGDVVKAGDHAGDVVKAGDNAGDVVKAGDNAGDVVKAGDNAGDVVKAGDKTSDVVKAGDSASDVVKAGDKAEDLVQVRKAFEEAQKSGYKQPFKRFQEIYAKGKRFNPETGAWYTPKAPAGTVDDAAGVIKAGDKTSDVVKAGDKTGDVVKAGDKAGDTVKAGDKAGDTVKAGDKAGDTVKAGDKAGDAVKAGDKAGDATKAPGDDKGFVEKFKGGYNAYDPKTAPEWLQKYKRTAELEARANNVALPRLQAAYDLFKGIAGSTYQTITGIGGDGNAIDNVSVIGANTPRIFTALFNWITGSAPKADDVEKSAPGSS